MKKATLNKAFLLVLTLALILAALVLTACNGTEGGTKDPEGSTSSTTDGSDDVGKNTDNSEHIHSFSEWRTMNEPTCTEDGLEEQECACGEKSSRPIPAKGHTEVVDAAKAPTCTETGLTEGKHCSACNTVFVKQEVIPATGHNFVNEICDKCGAPKPSEGLKYTLSDDGQSYRVEIGSCNHNNIVIPSTYNGKPVTSISDYAFSSSASLTSITIPNSVKSIGDHAFEGCKGLTSITVPDSVTSVGYNAFYNTAYYNNESNWVDSILYIGNYLISAKVTVYGSYTIRPGTKCIAGNAFYNCTGLKSITIPDSVKSIGNYAFYECTGLTSIIIPNSVTSIGNWAFYECANLTSITIPGSVTGIGDGAFSDCTSLTSITIPDSVTNIGYDVFYNTAYYNNESNWVDGVLYIGNHLIKTKDSVSGSYTIKDGTICIAGDAFYGCTGLKSIVIPDSVKSIDSMAFYGCTGLKSMTIPDSVKSIGWEAFYGCTGLKSVTIGNGVTIIYDSAFYKCNRLTSITFNGTIAQWDAIAKGSWWNYNTGFYTVHCTDGDIKK